MIGGPALVERAFGQPITKEELGGPHIHLRSGVVDNVAEDEPGVFTQIQQFLSYLPTNVWEAAPVRPCEEERNRQEEELLSIIPRNRRRAYSMRRVIECVVDRDSFF